MNETSTWFTEQLRSTGDGLVWSARLLPQRRWNLPPPRPFGEWSAARHLFHMCFYEEKVALPGMRIWLGDPMPGGEFDEDWAWRELADTSLESLCSRFLEVRQAQIDLLPRFEQADWEKVLPTGWGEVSLLWVVAKTFQHTAEHTHDILRLVLFWEAAEHFE
jgi:hypothetical protein